MIRSRVLINATSQDKEDASVGAKRKASEMDGGGEDDDGDDEDDDDDGDDSDYELSNNKRCAPSEHRACCFSDDQSVSGRQKTLFGSGRVKRKVSRTRMERAPSPCVVAWKGAFPTGDRLAVRFPCTRDPHVLAVCMVTATCCAVPSTCLPVARFQYLLEELLYHNYAVPFRQPGKQIETEADLHFLVLFLFRVGSFSLPACARLPNVSPFTVLTRRS